jgi:hypothetical protein
LASFSGSSLKLMRMLESFFIVSTQFELRFPSRSLRPLFADFAVKCFSDGQEKLFTAKHAKKIRKERKEQSTLDFVPNAFASFNSS